MNAIALIIKYLPALLAFKDVAGVFKEEHGQEKPWYISKRFWGAVVTFAGAISAVVAGIKLDPATIEGLAEAAVSIITVGTTGYGVALTIKGTLDKKKAD